MNLQTTGDLITFCLKLANVSGVGQTPGAQDITDGLTLLQTLMAGWQRRRWLVWDLADTSVISTGALSYTVGVGGDFNIPRPDKIDSAFARLLPSAGIQTIGTDGGLILLPANSPLPSSPVGLQPGAYWNDGGILARIPGGTNQTAPLFIDYPLAIIKAREDYNNITLKGLATFPGALFYDSAFPLASVFFWPVPTSGEFELHIACKASLPVYTTLTDPLNLPPEYLEALIWSCAVRFSILFGNPPQPSHVAAMNQALSVIRMANVQVPQLLVPTFRRFGNGGQSAGSSPGFNSGGMW